MAEEKCFIYRVVSIFAVGGAKERVTTTPKFQLDIILYISSHPLHHKDSLC